MLCCGASLGVDRPGRPMAVIKRIYYANDGSDNHERTPAQILPTQRYTDRLMGQFNFYNVTLFINIGNPLPKGFSGSGIHDNNFFLSQYVR